MKKSSKILLVLVLIISILTAYGCANYERNKIRYDGNPPGNNTVTDYKDVTNGAITGN